MKKLVLFDFDGVLINSEMFYLDFWSKNLSIHNIFFSEKDLIGKNNIQFLNQFDFTAVQIENLIFEKQKAETNFFKNAIMDDSLKLLIKLLSKHLTIAIVSNNSLFNITNFLINNDCFNFFNQIVSNDSGLKPKPNPEMYLKAILLHQIKKEEALIIEDSPIGFESAKKASIDFVEFNFMNLDNSINKIYRKLNINN